MSDTMMSKELQLILLMVDGFDYTAEDLCRKIGTTRRQLYNYLRKFREMGFVVINENQSYRLDPASSFFRSCFSASIARWNRRKESDGAGY